MKIRRIQYQIDCVHMLSFREEYKQLIAPYFGLDELTYSIDNEGTLSELLRLVYKAEGIIFILRKEGLVFVYEGDIDNLKRTQVIFEKFWEIYSKLQKEISTYTRTVRHSLTVVAVDVMSQEDAEKLMEEKKFMSFNPYGKLDEFTLVYEFVQKEISYKCSFGNYSERDIKLYDISPLKTEYNQDLKKSVGYMAKLEVTESDKAPSFSKFKTLLQKAEETLAKIYKLPDERK